MKLSEIHLENVKTLLLDRDGVINRLRPDDYVKKWSEFEFIHDIFPFLKEASHKVDNIFVVTNQRGVGKQLMSQSDLDDIHALMIAEINRKGGRIDEIFVCTALSDENEFRKPHIGMWNIIRQKYPSIKPETTLMIGDSDSDMEFAYNCGIRGIKIHSVR